MRKLTFPVPQLNTEKSPILFVRPLTLTAGIFARLSGSSTGGIKLLLKETERDNFTKEESMLVCGILCTADYCLETAQQVYEGTVKFVLIKYNVLLCLLRYQVLIQVNLPKRHLRVTATSDIRQLSELPIEIFNTKLPPSSGNLREAAQNHSPDGCRFGRFTCTSNYNRGYIREYELCVINKDISSFYKSTCS